MTHTSIVVITIVLAISALLLFGPTPPPKGLTLDIRIPRADLARGLRLASSVAAKKPTLPILADVLLRASKELSIAATDLAVSLTAEMACVVTKPGSIALNADDLRRFVASASGDEVTIKADGAWADVRCGKAKYRIAGHQAQDFPKIPEPAKGCEWVETDADELCDLLSRASYAVSQDESRQALCGVMLDYDGETLTVLSADSPRAVLISRKIPFPALPRRISLCVRGATEISRLLEDAGKCRVAVDGKRMHTTVDGETISAGLLDFECPAWERHLPKTGLASATMDRDRLLEALKRVASLASDYHGVGMRSTPTGLSLTVKDKDGEEMSDEIECEIKGEILIGAHPKHLIDTLTRMVGEPITMRTIGATDPIVFVDHGDAGYTGVVMPMRMD
jgi:DNA polymerase-3 subunit beta